MAVEEAVNGASPVAAESTAVASRTGTTTKTVVGAVKTQRRLVAEGAEVLTAEEVDDKRQCYAAAVGRGRQLSAATMSPIE